LQLDDVIADSKAIIAAQLEREKEQEQVNGQAEELSAMLSGVSIVFDVLLNMACFADSGHSFIYVEGRCRKCWSLQRTARHVACHGCGPGLGQVFF
jgi:hypothetical protein